MLLDFFFLMDIWKLMESCWNNKPYLRPNTNQANSDLVELAIWSGKPYQRPNANPDSWYGLEMIARINRAGENKGLSNVWNVKRFRNYGLSEYTYLTCLVLNSGSTDSSVSSSVTKLKLSPTLNLIMLFRFKLSRNERIRVRLVTIHRATLIWRQ